MTDYERGRFDAEENFILWMCRYDTSIKSLKGWLKSIGESKEYVRGYVAYMKEHTSGYTKLWSG